MSPDDELRAAFDALAGRAPDSGAVHDRITGRIARRHRARQAVAAGGAALAVGGIVAGSAVLHGAVGSHPVVAATTTPTTATAPAATGSTATPSTSPTSTVTRRGTSGATVTSPSTTEGATPLSVAPPAERAAFSGGGYDLGDAQELARLWGAPDAGLAKAVAGRRLLDGGSLPIEPGHRSSRQPTNYVAQAVYRFFGAGFDYDDAVRLAQLWKAEDVYTAKAVAGQMLLDGVPVPR
ncbi:hypothetical protein [Angustibacter aerolatus]